MTSYESRVEEAKASKQAEKNDEKADILDE